MMGIAALNPSYVLYRAKNDGRNRVVAAAA